MLISLPASPGVSFGTPAAALPKQDVALIAKAAASDPEVTEAHIISFQELHLMKSAELTVALITKAGSSADEVARRVHKALVGLAPGLERLTMFGLPIDHHLVNPIRCVQRQIVFDYGRN
jgi:hypothetical protein